MPQALSLDSFLQKPGVILDVRSPSEYQQGHLPNSHSFPLFTDEERKWIGTAYKQTSRKKAIHLGLQIIGPKLPALIETADHYLHNREGKILCWRGGMRSGSIAALLESLGYSVSTLQGGYRSFRRWVLKTLEHLSSHQPRLLIIGGLTGCGKTRILQTLRELKEQVIDLEEMAKHRGSAFGHIGLPIQPTQEQFENDLAFLFQHMDLSKPIWMEDESRLIGKRFIPASLFHLMSTAPLFYIERPLEERLNHLLELYSSASSDTLIESIHCISKRLGGKLTQETLNLIKQDDKKAALQLLLSYYDKAYHYQLNKRPIMYSLSGSFTSLQEWAIQLKNMSTQHES